MGVTGQQVAVMARSLLNSGTIPYVDGGKTLAGMDCQGLVRYVLEQLGVDHVKGTNTMWRTMLADRGTIEDGVKKYGKIPLGALIFIREYDGGEPAKYQGDGEGNVFHVYVKINDTGDDCLIHASESYGSVRLRSFADKTIPNGGPNLYGLIAGVDYTDSGGDVSAAQSGLAGAWKPKYAGYIYKYKRKNNGDLLCKGDGVREIQNALNLCGYAVDIDGEFGPLTEAAVINFQEDNRLEADGVVGRMTWAALADAVNE